jgi:hypothetical protein
MIYMSENIDCDVTSRDELDLSRYCLASEGGLPSGWFERPNKPQNQRKSAKDYWVWLPAEALGLGIHKPASKVMFYLYLESRFTRSPTVKVSFQRADRFFHLGCSRKTFYRAIKELEAAGAIVTKRQNGRSIEATLQMVDGGKNRGHPTSEGRENAQ